MAGPVPRERSASRPTAARRPRSSPVSARDCWPPRPRIELHDQVELPPRMVAQQRFQVERELHEDERVGTDLATLPNQRGYSQRDPVIDRAAEGDGAFAD